MDNWKRCNRLLDIMAIDVNIEQFFFNQHGQSLENNNNNNNKIVNLNVLDSFKHFGCIGVIGAHVLLTYLTLGTSYSHTIEDLGSDQRTMLLLSLNNIVDTFFVISGLLVAYLMFRKLDRSKQDGDEETCNKRQFSQSKLRLFVRIVAGRYFRMAPLYFLVYAFAKSLAVHLGSGPLWDYATNKDSLRGLCKRESWLWPLMFASDFKPITEHCVPPAWSIAVDLQFFLVLPLFIALLRSNKTRVSKLIGRLIFVLLIFGSTIYTLIDYKSLLSYVSLADFAKLRLHVFTVLIRYAAHAYSQPQNRMGPMLIGLMGGHLLWQYELKLGSKSTSRLEEEEDEEFEGRSKGEGEGREALNGWPWWMCGNYFRASLVASLLFIAAPTLVQLRKRLRVSHQNESHPLYSWLFALNTTTHFDCYLALGGFVLIKPLWSICNCVIFLRLATDLQNAGRIRKLITRLLSLNCWRTLSKLNYAILLIHFEFIAYESMSRLQLGPITWLYLVGKFSFAYLCSLALALPLYILFEQPMHKLTGWLLG